MFWKCKAPAPHPDVMLRRFLQSGSEYDQQFVASFQRSGRLWCQFRGDLYLLRDGGEVLGPSDLTMKWEFI